MIYPSKKNARNQQKTRCNHALQDIQDFQDILIEAVHEQTEQFIERQEMLGFESIFNEDFLGFFPHEDREIARKQRLQLQRDIKQRRLAAICWLCDNNEGAL